VSIQEVFVWAHGKGVSGKDPSPVTIGARMACLSSFYRFLIWTCPETVDSQDEKIVFSKGRFTWA
jgi:hypothetical protein